MYWRNSDFQWAHFIEAYTPDEKYRVLKQQLRERQKALALATAGKMREEMRRSDLKALVNARNDKMAKEAMAELLTLDAETMEVDDCIAACKHEIETIEKLLAEIEPKRKFAHLPDEEAFQACQEAEWVAKLLARAEDMLESQGFISWDHLRTMKSHPQWATRIQPAIQMKREELYTSHYRRAALVSGAQAYSTLGGSE
jgi:hypothetical protein